MKRGWMRFSLCASALVIVAVVATSSIGVRAQEGDSARRVNEVTLAGLRPGRDKLATALKLYKSKYLDGQEAGGAKGWLDNCTGRSLELELDGHSQILSVTVSSLGSQDSKCDQARFDALDMNKWVSGHGLRLGDPQDRVTELYGEPNSTGPSVKGDTELEFLYYAFDWAGSDVPQVMEVYCARDTGRVVEITLAYPSL